MVSEELADILGAEFIPRNDDDWDLLAAVARKHFEPTKPINENRLFAGRIPQIEKLIDAMYQAGAHAILFGERGVGKTSLSNIINQRVVGPHKFTKVLDVSCNQESTFAKIWSNVFFDFQWKEDGRKVGDLIKENPDPFAVWKVAESLPADKRYLVILDEFDRIQDESAKVLIADTIKYFSDRPLRFTILIVGVGTSIESLFGSHPSIKRCCVEIRMQRMTSWELRQIVEDRMPLLHMGIQESVIARMVQLSHGFPTYMHVLGRASALRAIAERTLIITDVHLNYAISRALDNATESTRQDYKKATHSTKPDNRYKEVLLACAMAAKNDMGEFSASDVCAPYSRIMGRPAAIGHFARHLDAFCTTDRGPTLVKTGKPKRYTYRFENPLLEPLVLMVSPQEPTAS